MDKNKIIRTRAAMRSAFTKLAQKLESELLKDHKDSTEIRASIEMLEIKNRELTELNQKYYDVIIDEEQGFEDLEKEFLNNDEYEVKFFKLRAMVSEMDERNRKVVLQNSSNDGLIDERSDNRRNFKLPQLEFKKFSGELREWLPFWSQFKKIDEDQFIDDSDKMQYLIQATIPGSNASNLLESFPAVGENYGKAIKCLKDRFGRDELLIEVYIRDLLSMVLQNMMSNKKTTLATLYDQLECKLRALETLKITTDKCAAMLMPLVESCLPEDILRAWQRSDSFSIKIETKSLEKENEEIASSAQTRLNQLMEFLRKELENEQKVKLALSGFGVEKVMENKCEFRSKDKNNRVTSNTKFMHTATDLVSTEIEKKCIFCEKDHHSLECPKAFKMSINDRKKMIEKSHCCFNCLKKGHQWKTCWSKMRCTVCHGKHNSFICSTAKLSKDGEVIECDKTLAHIEKSCKVILQTLLVKIKSGANEYIARAIIDNASQRSYILRELAVKLKGKCLRKEKVKHALFGGINTNIIQHNIYTFLLSDLNENFCCQFEMLDQDIICGNVDPIPIGPWLDELKQNDIEVTDLRNRNIEVLIGADISGKILTGKTYELSSGLVAIETKLGWTLMGRVPSDKKDESLALTAVSMLTTQYELSELWSLESLGIEPPSARKLKEEILTETEEHFLKTVCVDSEGRYEIKLPWKEDHPSLTSNYDLSLKRLNSTLKKLNVENIYDDYDMMFKEWMKDGIIEEVNEENLENKKYYLPHMPVVKPNSTTRVRPVFDASAKEKNYASLNDCLETGPNLIELIPSILLKFRIGRIGVISDIKRAFLQISVSKDDRKFLCFLWYDEQGNIKVFRHKRVVFGVKCSPYLLGAVIKYHLQNLDKICKENGESHSTDVVEKLLNGFYVDNCITSVNNESELKLFIEEATSIMKCAKFDLRCWEYSKQMYELNDEWSNVLGLQWNREDDVLKVNLNNVNSFNILQITKRTILSAVHRVFDPIGVTCPVTLLPKLLLQQMWVRKVSWDQPVDDNIASQFISWFRNLKYIENVKIPRWLLGTSNTAKYSLHVFCDASQYAYASVIYLRTETDTEINVELVQAKSRIAPIRKNKKEMTIPRLELLAANIGARLYNDIKDNLNVIVDEVTFWSDSTTVIAWIRRDVQWDIFVRNRVQEIKDITKKGQWSYIPGMCNPADLPSRGCSAKKLSESQWWKGPNWLRQSKELWPDKGELTYDECEINKEKKKTVVSSTLICNNVSLKENNDWYHRYFSRYRQVVRMVAWTIRFYKNCSRMKNERCTNSSLLSFEISEAEIKVLRMVQQESFEGLNDAKLKSLQPFVDQDGLIKIKTRILHEDYQSEFCSPIVLPNHHSLVKKLIFEIHSETCHSGVQITLMTLRKKFWVLGGRKTVRSVINTCIKCKRYSSKRIEVLSPPLPPDRIKMANVFEVIGIDFAGPVYIKQQKGQEIYKAWICLFTCAVYRAVHLELVSSMSTDGFIQCLRKFISRRGRPRVIYTDNGTNFVGAANALANVDWNEIAQKSTCDKIHWKFNPPTAPWWGGWWERLIGLLKQLLKRILGRSSLDFEEMQTVLCECEAVINSRPLTYVSEDVQDLIPLTPDVFLKEIKESGVVDLDLVEAVDINRRMKYRLDLRRQLKERFHSEYMSKLILHSSKFSKQSVKVGDLVLVEYDNLKRMNWPLARVTELIPGVDGTSRLVKLKTENGILLRPIQRVYPLELQFVQSEEEQYIVHHGVNITSVKCEGLIKTATTDTDNEDQNCADQTKQTRSGRIIKPPHKLDI